MSEPEPVVLYEAAERIARVRMNRPQYRNAQSGELLRELDAAFTRAVEDPEVRVIVLSGVGEAFSAGHDLGTPEQTAERDKRNQRKGPRSGVEAAFDWSWEHFVDMSLRWRDLPKPTIAQVHGWCIFGGWLVASSMDLIIAADDSRFLTNLVQYFTLPYDVGVRKAKEMLFDNRELTAHEALELGYVNHVVPRDELEDFTTAMATRIAANSSFFLRMAKLAVNGAQDAAGFRAAVQGAHAHYQLSQTANEQWRRMRERAGEIEPLQPGAKRSLVGNLINQDRSSE